MLKMIWREVPHMSMDYGFFGEKLVIRERRHTMTRAMLVPRKGTAFPWIARRAAKFIDQLEHNRVQKLRCDNEPAIEPLAEEIAQARQEGSRLCQREHQWVGLVAGQATTLKAASEHRIGVKVPFHAKGTVLGGGARFVGMRGFHARE